MALISYSPPKWGDIEAKNPNLKLGDNPLASTTIAYEGGDETATAFQFCSELNYQLSSFIVGGKADPSVTYDLGNEQWKEAGSKDKFLSITCDNGINESLGEVNIANIGDIMFLLAVLISVSMIHVTLLVFGRN